MDIKEAREIIYSSDKKRSWSKEAVYQFVQAFFC